MAPGVDHCGGGNGPHPSGQFNVHWVDSGKAPNTSEAGASPESRQPGKRDYRHLKNYAATTRECRGAADR